STVDERKDPLESTRAAASLLAENYDMFGSWPLAITAYNHGRNGIRRAIDRVGSDDLMDIIRKYKSRRFGVASKNFYAEFLAAVEVARRDEEYLPGIEYHAPVRIAELKLKEPISVSYLLRAANVSRKEFLSWNPALSRKIQIIPKWYRIKVPEPKVEVLARAYERAISAPWVKHRVARGETLSEIARAYRIPVSEIKSLNALANIHFITVGQQLKIPRR
ncbi:MAG: LysM peptidoglycan-binding domain-containing protein, partial [Deltaproteobacteria bacterium]|nr:LysM peptidoglycan-binding domain-containing protein [Deltaproteobacteria bacterium]